MTRKICIGAMMLGLMLNGASAWADVDISGKEKIEVGTWADLKTAVESSANAGKVIVLTANIQADVNTPITSVGGEGIIIDGGGHTITGQEGTSYGQLIKFDYSETDLIIQNVNLKGFVAKTSSYAYGGAIYNGGTIGDISGDFTNNSAQGSSFAKGGAINNSGTIGDISGDFEGNYAQSTGTSSSSSANGGAIYNNGSSARIENIIGNFEGNSAQSDSSSAKGGAIHNSGSSARIENIIGNFEGNYAKSTGTSSSSSANGGAIYNSGNIGDISGNFTSNSAQSDSSSASGGAIYNQGSALTLVNSSFKDNYVQTGAEKDSAEGKTTLGGAIASLGNLTIQADNGESIFSGNKVKWTDGEDSSAITLISQGLPLKLMLDSRNQGLIQFDDKISSLGSLDVMLLDAEAQGATVQDDGEGGYLVDMGGQQFHLKKTENGVLFPQDQKNGLSQADVEQMIATFPPEWDVKQEGDNYIVTGEDGGQMWVFEFVKQEDDTYVMTQNMPLSENGADIFITGDSTSKVVFNNAIEKMEKIDISGTNVEVNEGAGTIYRTVTHDGGVLNINAGAKAEDSILNNLGTMNVKGGTAQSTVVNSGGVMNIAEGGTAVETEVNDGGAVNINGGAAENTVVNSGGVMNIAESGSALKTEVNGTLHVSSGGLAKNTVVNKDGLLVAENQAKVNNMLANDGAKLDIDAGSYLTGDIVIHAGASMGGSYDYGKIFKDEVVDSGSLTLVGGLNDILNENSLINTTAEKKLNLTAGDYVIGDGAQAVRGWDLLTIKDTATVKLEGDITLNGPNKKLIIENGSKLDLAGHSPSDYTITGSVNNDGTLVFTHQDDGADDVTTIYGNYKAYQNAQMDIDVDPINNVADLLKIEGDVEGKTDVVLYALSPERPSEMIKFVEAPNDDLSTGAAFSIFRVYGSGYQWNSLYQDGNWYTATNDIISDGSTDGYGDSDVGAMEDDEDLEADADLPSEFPNPDEGDGSNPDEGEGTDPDEGEGTDPDEGEGTDPDEGEGSNPDEGEGSNPDEGDGSNPDEGEGTDPDEGDGSNPDEGGSTPPAQPSVVGEAIAYMGLPSAGIEQTRGMTRRVADKVMATKLYNQKCGGFYDCRYDGNRLYNAWVSPVYTYSDVKAPYRYEADVSGVEAGFDLQSDAFNRLGVFFSYRQGNYDFDGKGDDYSSKIGSEIDIDSYIAGLFHRYDKGRLWTMEQLFVGYQDVDIASDDGVSAGTDGVEFGASVGAGVVYTPLPDVTVEPMITADYTQINYDNLSDNYGKTARFKDVRYLELEAGVKVEKTFKRQFGYAKFYLKPSLVQTFGRGKVQVSSLSLVDGIENMTLGRLELGGSINFDNAWSGYANAAYTFGSDYLNAAVNAGLNYAF